MTATHGRRHGQKQRRKFLNSKTIFILALFTATSFTACGSKNSTSDSAAAVTDSKPSLPDTSFTDPANPEVKETTPGASASTTPIPSNPSLPAHSYITDVMLFNGLGISTSDWQSTENIIKSAKLSYKLVNSRQLDAMTLDEMSNFGVMIFPGGHGDVITKGVLASTAIRVRHAVRDRGVGFVGMCAGAWIAVGPEANTESKAAYGFAVANGKQLSLYYPGGKLPTAAVENVSFPDGTHRYLIWWGGPSTPNWTNGVVAKYVTGEPAVSQTWSGKGFVIVTGPHPEAPQGWRYTAGNDPDGLDYDLFMKIVKAALYQKPMAVF